MTPPRDPADTVSGMCAKGQHGRCGGWMIVPNFNKKLKTPDISIRCRCPQCGHPEVDPLKHIDPKER